MATLENTKRFIDAIKDTTSQIHPMYRRNFREFIKLVPVIGSIIEANTMGVIEDNILEERLTNLELACQRALTLEDAEQLLSEIHNINSIFLLISITNQGQLLEQGRKIAKELKQLENRTQNSQSRTPDKNFIFITISGASAVGKDCVLDTIFSRKKQTTRIIEALTKFSNRPRRIVDSKYYNFLTNEEYDILEKSGNVIFSYYKRGFRYGFDRTHLFNAAAEPQFLFAIFTHFESLPTDRDFLLHKGINHIAVLLTAEHDTLLRRSERRLLDTNDIEARKKSINQDLRFIEDNRHLIDHCFDLIIDNSDGHSVYETCNKILQKVGLSEIISTKC